MNRLYKVLKTAVWCVIGVFLGVTGYTCWDYHAHPGLYALQSAPWYTSIQIHAVFTAVVVGVLLAGMWFLKRRRK